MAGLVFPNDFYLAGVTPQSAQYELDRITRHWKTNGATEEEVLSCPTLPQKGDAHPLFPFMFVTDLQTQETGNSACALNVNYTGAFRDDGRGNPILPPAKNFSGSEVSSASSKKLNTGLLLTESATAQYYAPITTTSFFTYLGKATSGFAPDPTDDPSASILTLTIGDTSLSSGGVVSTLIAELFTTQIVHTLQAPEVVAGKYWQNTSKKIRTLFPWIFSITPGNYILLAAPGQGYTVGNNLVMNSVSGNAIIQVATVGLGGSVRTWTVLSSTFAVTTPIIYTSGGSGTGAGFINYHI